MNPSINDSVEESSSIAPVPPSIKAPFVIEGPIQINDILVIQYIFFFLTLALFYILLHIPNIFILCMFNLGCSIVFSIGDVVRILFLLSILNVQNPSSLILPFSYENVLGAKILFNLLIFQR